MGIVPFSPAGYYQDTMIKPGINLGQAQPDQKKNVIDSFGEVLTKALGQVNDLQIKSDDMVNKMITEPGKVNIHEVTTLLSQAEMTLSMTKAITDRVVTAYREITNLR